VFSDLSKEAESRFGFEIHPYHFAVPGRCRLCRNRSEPRPVRTSQPGRRSSRGRATPA
jgi:hypothetical protein